MTKIYLLIACLFMVQIGLTQNLVPNGDFEQYTICPTTTGDLNATSWVAATSGTADYFNQCANGSSVGVPSNFFGSQNARSGLAYCGINIYYYQGQFLPNYREYIETPLVSPLVAGSCYHFEMYVSQAEESPVSISDIGVHFSVGQVNVPTFFALMLTPQITNLTGLLIDKSNWMLIEGDFMATGGEDHIVLGSFKNDANTNLLVNSSGTNGYSYYYIDDVSLQLSTPSQINLGNDTSLCQGESLILDATTLGASYVWQDGSTDSTFNVNQQGEYWVEVTATCETLRDTININYHPMVTVNLGNDIVLCQGESLILDATTSNATYLWQDNSTNSTFNVTQQGDYWVRATIENCNASDTVLIIEEDCNITFEVPNVFTPNGDGNNDAFVVLSDNLISLKGSIFNRWGNSVYSWGDVNGSWDGRTSSGKEVSEGTYFYIIEYTYNNGSEMVEKTVKGTVTLLR